MKSLILLTTAALLAAGLTAIAAPPVDPATFDKDGDGLLSSEELTRYVIKRDKLKVASSVFLNDDLSPKPDAAGLARKNLQQQADKVIGAYEAQLEGPAPHSIAAIQRQDGLVRGTDGILMTAANAQEATQLKIPGFFGEPSKAGHTSRGPFLLRKSTDGWSDALTDAAGAVVSYSDNHEADKRTWLTEGAIIYPIQYSLDRTATDRTHSIRSERMTFLPSVNWKVVKVSQNQADDVEELQFSAPVVWSANLGTGTELRNNEFSLSPYLLTDFSLRGRLLGATASYQPYLLTANGGFALNAGYRGLGDGPFLYRLGLVPSLDFNHLAKTSRFLTRDDQDDYFRGGVQAAFGLRTNTLPSLEFLATYQGFWSIRGGPARSHLIDVSAKLWLNDCSAFSLGYQEGTTPVASKDVNLLTLGLELRL